VDSIFFFHRDAETQRHRDTEKREFLLYFSAPQQSFLFPTRPSALKENHLERAFLQGPRKKRIIVVGAMNKCPALAGVAP
jgi:hypothetical protein